MKTLLMIALVALVAICATGCGVMGVREFEVWSGGPKWEFSEGMDFHVGANAIDTVDNKRGVSPRSRRIKVNN